MIIGIGTDIIEIERIKMVIERTPNFINKIFSENEIRLFESKSMNVETIAGNFAAKEAISKAIGTGVRGFSLNELEILRDELGKPIVKVSLNVERIIKLDNFNIHVSISHNKTSAIAFSILEEKN